MGGLVALAANFCGLFGCSMPLEDYLLVLTGRRRRRRGAFLALTGDSVVLAGRRRRRHDAQ